VSPGADPFRRGGWWTDAAARRRQGPEGESRAIRIRDLLVLLPGDRLGGAEAHTLRLCDAAAAAGVAVTLAAEGRLHAGLVGAGRRLLDLPVAWRRGLPEAARAAQAGATRAALEAARPDAALLPLPWPDRGGGAMEALAAAGTPTLVVAHLAPHGAEEASGVDEGAIAAARALRAEWVAVSAPTAARAARVLGLPEGRIATIPNGVDPAPPPDRPALRAALRDALGVAPGTPVALFVGRLDEAKGADRLPALAEAFARRTSGVLACAGQGSLDDTLWRATPEEGHPLRLLGQTASPAALMAGADALVMPSRLEGAPLTFLEAAGLGLPVAASHEALEALGGEASRLAAVADAEDLGAMADALASCLEPAAAARTAAAGALAAGWDAAAMSARYLSRLRRLAAPPPGTPLLGAPLLGAPPGG